MIKRKATKSPSNELDGWFWTVKISKNLWEVVGTLNKFWKWISWKEAIESPSNELDDWFWAVKISKNLWDSTLVHRINFLKC